MVKHCRWAKSGMTPCVFRDGDVAYVFGPGNEPVCVGCERAPNEIECPAPKIWPPEPRKPVKQDRRHRARPTVAATGVAADAVRDCATKIGAWPTNHLPFEHARVVQRELGQIAAWLRLRSLAIRNGDAAGVYDK